jgi:phosphomannomutase
VVLETMALTGQTLADLAAQLPRYVMRKGELSCPPNLVHKAVEGFRGRYARNEPDCSDGVRVEWDDGWLHVRASNTEPLLRVIVEAETAVRAEALFDEAMTFARRLAFGHEGA